MIVNRLSYSLEKVGHNVRGPITSGAQLSIPKTLPRRVRLGHLMSFLRLVGLEIMLNISAAAGIRVYGTSRLVLASSNARETTEDCRPRGDFRHAVHEALI